MILSQLVASDAFRRQIAYTNAYNEPVHEFRAPKFFHYPTSLIAYEHEVKYIIGTNSICNYVVTDKTKVTGYIVNKVFWQIEY